MFFHLWKTLDSTAMWSAKTLLLTDQNLGRDAHERLSAFCTDLTWLSWVHPDEDTRSKVLAQIDAEPWELVISFYSDLILPQSSLERMALPLNIHPALPVIRGVGYDVVPLIEGHATVGATLHHVERRIDSGRIYRVLEIPLDGEHTATSLRLMNQHSSLQMLDLLCSAMRASNDVGQLRQRLEQQATTTEKSWNPTYTCRRTVRALLDEIRTGCPEHPCLR
jgi:methionyl-tRNA formyltransferase